jgi:ATP-binding cassette subfamily B protein
MVILFVLKSVGTLLDLASPMIFAHIVDNVAPTKDVKTILLWGGLILVVAFISLQFNVIPNRMAVRIARDVTEKIRNDLFEKTLSLSGGQIDRLTLSSIESRLTADTYNIHEFLNNMMRMGIRTPIMLIGGIFVIWAQDGALTLALVGALPIMGAVVWKISGKGISMYADMQKTIDGMVRIVRENIVGVRVIKALSKTGYERERFDRDNSAVSDRETEAGVIMAMTNPAMNLLLNVGLVVIVIVGAFRVNDGLTKPGVIVAFLTYFTMFSSAMLWITRIFVSYSRGMASSERIKEIMDLPNEPEIWPAVRIKDKNAPRVEFKNVSFSYDKKKNNIENISFTIGKGETLGILGSTGSGKSALINLLMRFYDCDSGEIRVDGELVNAIAPEELYPKFGVAFQNDIIFAGGIAENIDFGRGLSMKRISEAALNAQATFIEDKPNGLNHRLAARGTNVSGGQKQRLIIARALASKPDILILDDSSSALDYTTDAALRRSIAKNYRETTLIIVAQRISSVMNADKIIALDDGKLVGYGTHRFLSENCEFYNEIYVSQMGGGESHQSSSL